MRVLFRVDASIDIGSGHVTRCAALAQGFKDKGHEVLFLCRLLTGSLKSWLEAQGFEVLTIDPCTSAGEADDAAASRRMIDRRIDWIVVDHYRLGRAWEQAMAGVTAHILAIDDLGRPHHCDILLDPNLASPVHDLYRGRVPAACALLLGPQSAPLRPEFAALRPKALSRDRGDVARVLVFMGGSDPANETCKVLDGLAMTRRPLAADVVIGQANPNRFAVEHACRRLTNARLHVQTTRMAELMSRADCAIGSAGSATWERCALGLPAIVSVLFDNQATIAESVHAAGAHRSLGWHDALDAKDYAQALLALDAVVLRRMSESAAQICDGGGVDRVVACLSIDLGRDLRSLPA
jgi:UDP-2,4-diacetamido-2,4,6-trideoxy-beta-L-altropyranose hydrolase